MNRKDLLRMAFYQKMSGCLIRGGICSYHLCYKSYHFCVSEIFGESCQMEKSVVPEAAFPQMGRLNLSLLPPGGLVTIDPSLERNKVEFKVYCKDPLTATMRLLGRITEKRGRERGNNLRDLLIKAIQDYSPFAQDPSTIFLLGS